MMPLLLQPAADNGRLCQENVKAPRHIQGKPRMLVIRIETRCTEMIHCEGSGVLIGEFPLRLLVCMWTLTEDGCFPLCSHSLVIIARTIFPCLLLLLMMAPLYPFQIVAFGVLVTSSGFVKPSSSFEGALFFSCEPHSTIGEPTS